MNVIIVLSFLLLISHSYAETTDDNVLSQFTTGVTEGATTELIIELLVVILPLQLVAFIFTLILIIIIGFFIFNGEFRHALFDYLFSYEGLGYFTGCLLTHRTISSIKTE